VDVPASDGLLVVAIEDVGGIPGGILVGDLFDLRALGVAPGMTFAWTTGGWAMSEAGVTIRRAAARVWSPALPATARLTETSEVHGRLELARAVAAWRAPSAGLGPLLAGGGGGDPWFPTAATLIERLIIALTNHDLEQAVEPAVGLVGLGPGLTPSGDDFLVGLLAGLEAAEHPARTPIAAAVAEAASGRTTAIGAAALRHAAAGAYAERIHDVLAAIVSGPTRDVTVAVTRAMAYGATSGADTLVGLSAAIGIVSAGAAGVEPADPAGTDGSDTVAA
jgi:hypothetical protein